jgi:hypothetical protein
MLRETTSPMARAWLRIGLRVNGIFVEPRDSRAADRSVQEKAADRALDRSAQEKAGDKISPDVLITALEALGSPDGNYSLLKVTA